jgi:hypothetical protein
MHKLLSQHLNRRVGINYLRPHHIDAAMVVAVEDDWFTIRGEEDGTLHHYPYGNIIQVAEKEGGIDVGGMFTQTQHFDIIIKVGHLVDVVPVA